MHNNKVLIVDDEDINIDLLKNALESEYEIFVAKNGINCIDIMKKIKPGIVLLDILMPEKDGFSTLEMIKKNSDIADIPIIFITALRDSSNVTKAFEMGAEDYITKPFNSLEVKARVKTHIEKNLAQQEIKILLMKTLNGSINMLMEVLAISNPDAYSISKRIKELVLKIANKLNYHDIWRLELAGMLSLIGCHAIPVLILEKILLGQKVSFEERKLFDSYAENGAKLIAKIPRLENIATLVKNQNNFYGNVRLEPSNSELMDGVILNHAIDFELLKARGIPGDVAVLMMKTEKNKYNNKIVEILTAIVEAEKEYRLREINIQTLEADMIIGKDLKTHKGNVILKKGTIVNLILKEHLMSLFHIGEIENTVWIKH